MFTESPGFNSSGFGSSANTNRAAPLSSTTHSVSSWSYQKPSGDAWPRETIRSAREARGEPAEGWEIFCALFTDRMIRVPSLGFLEAHTARGGRGRSYLFGWESPVKALGACHALEIPFCLGTLNAAEGMAGFAGSGPEADGLMETMRDLWIAFARGDESGLARWPLFDAERRASMLFAAESHASDAPCEPERAALAALDSGEPFE